VTDYPLLCINAHCRPEKDGGPRRTERAWFCPVCIVKARDRLHYIAASWADLESSLMQGGGAHGEPVGGSKEFGLVLNEQAAAARTKATTDLWSYARMVFDWADEQDRSIASPRDQTPPGLARWIADWHLAVFTTHAGRYTAVAFMDDVWAIRSAVQKAAYPSGARKVETGLRCTEHATSVEGERIPCEGEMVAWVSPDAKVMPDLVCTSDTQHRIDPMTWQHEGWKRAHARPYDAMGVARLAGKLGG
jgi:hypothetical protein